jgi:protoheme IX farnesyltransferase
VSTERELEACAPRKVGLNLREAEVKERVEWSRLRYVQSSAAGRGNIAMALQAFRHEIAGLILPLTESEFRGSDELSVTEAGTRLTRRDRLRAWYELCKPGIVGYVMITVGVAAYVASRGRVELSLVVHAMVATGLGTGGSLALNQYAEREPDAIMLRTQGRPIPSGRLRPAEARWFGSALLVVGLAYMFAFVGWLPTLLSAVSAGAYHWVYRPLKSRSALATLAGAMPGAMPALIGSTAATGRIDGIGLALFAIAYLWQLPHVLGLAWMLREDYARVGFRLIPGGPNAERRVGRAIVASTLLLVPVSLLPAVLGYTGRWYLVGALVASLSFLWVGLRSARPLTDDSARRVFLASLLFHPVLLCLMLLNTIKG